MPTFISQARTQQPLLPIVVAAKKVDVTERAIDVSAVRSFADRCNSLLVFRSIASVAGIVLSLSHAPLLENVADVYSGNRKPPLQIWFQCRPPLQIC